MHVRLAFNKEMTVGDGDTVHSVDEELCQPRVGAWDKPIESFGTKPLLDKPFQDFGFAGEQIVQGGVAQVLQAVQNRPLAGSMKGSVGDFLLDRLGVHVAELPHELFGRYRNLVGYRRGW